MSTLTQHGYLVLADISGYTSYLAGVELDHAQEILTDLLEVIVRSFKKSLTISKLEGDAVFGYVSEMQVTRGETLLELVELTYAAFHDRIRSSTRHTTCQCRACQSMPALELKFFIHHGDYMIQRVSGIHELVGLDVNLVHRLLKNNVAVNTGWNAYVMLTQRSLDHLGVLPEGLHREVETYEHIGDIETFSYDLKPRYAQLVRSRRVIVQPEEALVKFVRDFPIPAPVVWDWLNDPAKRAQYTMQPGLRFQTVYAPSGRRGVGAKTHCMHGASVAMQETVLDWHPFDYFTVNQDSGAFFGNVDCTFRLEPLEGATSTRLIVTMKGGNDPGVFRRFFLRMMFGRMFMPTLMNNMAARIADEQASTSDAPAPATT